jgi:hypothetical protein
MEPKPERTFSIHDSTISIWQEVNKPVQSPCTPLMVEMYAKIRALMKASGYTWSKDPSKRPYGVWYKYNHVGGKSGSGALRFHSEIGGRTGKVEFFEDVPRDNKNGGRYTSQKLKKMPYLMRLRVVIMLRNLAGLLEQNGFIETTNTVPIGAAAAIEFHRAELSDFQGAHFYTGTGTNYWSSYNRNDQDGIALTDGDLRYFREPNGRLSRGTVYRNINNMWWVLVNKDHYTNVANFRLFRFDPSRHPRKTSNEPRQRVGAALSRAVVHMDYHRAERIKQYIERTYGLPCIERGMKVKVEHPQFHGTGTAEVIDALFVGVRLSNGNLWTYERSTVSPAEVTTRA